MKRFTNGAAGRGARHVSGRLVGDGDGAGELGLAWTDVAAGEFKAGEFDLEYAAAELQRLQPAEGFCDVGVG